MKLISETDMMHCSNGKLKLYSGVVASGSKTETTRQFLIIHTYIDYEYFILHKLLWIIGSAFHLQYAHGNTYLQSFQTICIYLNKAAEVNGCIHTIFIVWNHRTHIRFHFCYLLLLASQLFTLIFPSIVSFSLSPNLSLVLSFNLPSFGGAFKPYTKPMKCYQKPRIMQRKCISYWNCVAAGLQQIH